MTVAQWEAKANKLVDEIMELRIKMAKIEGSDTIKMPEPTRIEVIGTEREYVKTGTQIEEIQYQDGGRTMKIFLKS
jgi:hypothetical protein